MLLFLLISKCKSYTFVFEKQFSKNNALLQNKLRFKSFEYSPKNTKTLYKYGKKSSV